MDGLWRTAVMSLLWWWSFTTSPPVPAQAWVSQNHLSTKVIFCLFSFNGINMILVLRCFGETQPWTVAQHGWSMRERKRKESFLQYDWLKIARNKKKSTMLNIHSAGVDIFSMLLPLVHQPLVLHQPLVINSLPWIYFAHFCQSNSNISQGLE